MRRHLFVIALLWLVTLGVFSRVLQAEFVAWDDERTVPGNPSVQGLDAQRLGWMFTNVSFAMRYKPLCWLSYALIHAAAGLNPLAYHLANLVFHCLNVALVYFVIRELLLLGHAPQPETESEPRHLAWCAGLGALAWAVHPLRVEAVARVTDLAYCEALFFLLISLLCYLRANASPQPAGRRNGFYWGAVGAFALSMLTYPFAFGYAVVLVVLDVYPLRRFSRDRRADRVTLPLLLWRRGSGRGGRLSFSRPWFVATFQRVATLINRAGGLRTTTSSPCPSPPVEEREIAPRPVCPETRVSDSEDGRTPAPPLSAGRRIWLEKVPFVLLGGLVLLTLLGRLNPAGAWTLFEPSHRLTVLAKAMQACYIWAYYLWKPWVPLHLAPVYSILVSFHPGDVPFLASAGLVMGLTALLVWQRRRWPWALALWVCHLVLLAPALGLTEHPHYPSDRYSYIPGVLWSVLLAAALLRLSGRPRVFAGAVGASLALVAVLGTMSVRQTRIWRDSVSLFEYTLATLGNDPYRAEIHWRLGETYARQQKLDEAIKQYRLTLAIDSKVSAHYFLARALQAQGKLDEALDEYGQVLRQQPQAEVHESMAELLADQGRIQEAVAHYREALRLQPGLWPALNNLAWIMATNPDPANRNGKEAVQLAEQACVVTGQRVAQPLGALAAAYAEAGRFAEAVTTAEKAVRLADQASQPEVAARNRQLLALYRAGKPYREPAVPAARP